MLSVLVKSNPILTDNAGQGSGEPFAQSLNDQTLKQDGRLPASRFILFFCVALLGVAADLITKHLAFKHYFNPANGRQDEHWWIEGIFGLQTATNPGALFGMGSGLSWLFAILSVVAISVIIGWLFFFGGARDRWLTFTLALITGGILGNLYDRVGLGAMPNYPPEIHNNVRDWIYFRLDGVPMFEPWPNFNLADCWLVCGAGLLFFHALFLAPEEETAATENAEQENS